MKLLGMLLLSTVVSAQSNPFSNTLKPSQLSTLGKPAGLRNNVSNCLLSQEDPIMGLGNVGVNSSLSQMTGHPLLMASLDPLPELFSQAMNAVHAGTNCTPASPITNPYFSVEYEAYIPVDHISGPTSCTAGGPAFIYLGDRQQDPVKGGSPYSHRVGMVTTVYPKSGTEANYSYDTGYTWQFSVGSPVNKNYITSPDYDGKTNDCKLYNNQGHLILNVTPSATANHNVIFYTGTQSADVNFNGQAQNPLEPAVAHIAWNVTTTIFSVAADGYSGRAKVSGNVTCYPAHKVTVTNLVIAVGPNVPLQPSTAYLFNCLSVQGATYPLTGAGVSASGTVVDSY